MRPGGAEVSAGCGYAIALQEEELHSGFVGKHRGLDTGIDK